MIPLFEKTKQKIQNYQPSEEDKIWTTIFNAITKLYSKGYNVHTPRELVNCIDTNHLNTEEFHFPYEYATLRTEILSGKFDSNYNESETDVDELLRKYENGELPDLQILE